MLIKITKTNPNATIPYYGESGNGAMNLVATEIKSESFFDITYGTGIALEIPQGHVGLVFPKSHIKDYTIRLSDSISVIDSQNKSEIQCTFTKENSAQGDIKYQVGDVIAQLIVISSPPVIFFEEPQDTIEPPPGNFFTLDGNMGV